MPYEEAIRVPLIIRWGGHLPAGVTRPRLALNIDLAPTIAVAAGIDPLSQPLGLDRNGVPRLAEGLNLFGSALHRAFVLEHYDNYRAVPPYCGIRTKAGYMYARYWDGRATAPSNGFEELYDVTADPFELHNLAGKAASQAKLAALRAKAISRCDPAPPGYVWTP